MELKANAAFVLLVIVTVIIAVTVARPMACVYRDQDCYLQAFQESKSGVEWAFGGAATVFGGAATGVEWAFGGAATGFEWIFLYWGKIWSSTALAIVLYGAVFTNNVLGPLKDAWVAVFNAYKDGYSEVKQAAMELWAASSIKNLLQFALFVVITTSVPEVMKAFGKSLEKIVKITN